MDLINIPKILSFAGGENLANKLTTWFYHWPMAGFFTLPPKAAGTACTQKETVEKACPEADPLLAGC
jgi:hypothetical protein